MLREDAEDCVVVIKSFSRNAMKEVRRITNGSIILPQLVKKMAPSSQDSDRSRAY